MDSIDESVAKLKGEVGGWEGIIYDWACEIARKMTKAILEKIDKVLMKERPEGLKEEGLREHWVTTIFGDVKIRRRLYRDKEGNSCFLLDKAMGLRKRSRISPRIEEIATFLCSYLPFENCERLLRAILPDGISHTTIHRLVSRVVDPYVEEEEKEIAEVYEDGVIPESEGRVVPYLMLEADGTSIALQREDKRRAEVKVGVAYEGWKMIGADRYKLKEKTSYTGIMNGEKFWEGFSLALAKKYDLAEVGQVIVGSDGAEWAKEGANHLGGIHQLDRFHLLRALRRGVRDELVNMVYQACIKGNVAEADGLLRQAQEEASGEEPRRIAKLRGYLLNNANGLRDYRLETGYDGMRGLGGIESNVDKLIANRMKKRGMSWTERGAHRMARLINLREMGELHQWINHRPEKQKSISITEKKFKTKKCKMTKDSGQWLEADLPAIFGPHANHPWVRALRAISLGNRIVSVHSTGIQPTKS